MNRLVLDATVTSTNVTCNGAGDGTIILSSPTGGYGTYSYTVNGGVHMAGIRNFTGLTPGTYDVRIRDAVHTGCVITLDGSSWILHNHRRFQLLLASTNVTCYGADDGTITISGVQEAIAHMNILSMEVRHGRQPVIIRDWPRAFTMSR